MKLFDIFYFVCAVFVSIMLVALGKRAVNRYLRSGRASRIAFFVVMVFLFVGDRITFAENRADAKDKGRKDKSGVEDAEIDEKERQNANTYVSNYCFALSYWRAMESKYESYRQNVKEKGAEHKDSIADRDEFISSLDRVVQGGNEDGEQRKKIKDYFIDVLDGKKDVINVVERLNTIAEVAAVLGKNGVCSRWAVNIMLAELEDVCKLKDLITEREGLRDEIENAVRRAFEAMNLLEMRETALRAAVSGFEADLPFALRSKAGPSRVLLRIMPKYLNQMAQYKKDGYKTPFDINGVSVIEGVVDLSGSRKTIKDGEFSMPKYGLITTREKAVLKIANGGEIELPQNEIITAFEIMNIARNKCADNIKKIIESLGDDDFAKREQASEQLRQMGIIAIPFLKEAQNHSDPEIKLRANKLLNEKK